MTIKGQRPEREGPGGLRPVRTCLESKAVSTSSRNSPASDGNEQAVTPCGVSAVWPAMARPTRQPIDARPRPRAPSHAAPRVRAVAMLVPARRCACGLETYAFHQLLQCLVLRWGYGGLCAALLLASFIMLYSMPILVSQFWSAATGPTSHHQLIRHESSMMITR